MALDLSRLGKDREVPRIELEEWRIEIRDEVVVPVRQVIGDDQIGESAPRGFEIVEEADAEDQAGLERLRAARDHAVVDRADVPPEVLEVQTSPASGRHVVVSEDGAQQAVAADFDCARMGGRLADLGGGTGEVDLDGTAVSAGLADPADRRSYDRRP